jgi:hypothetical protein
MDRTRQQPGAAPVTEAEEVLVEALGFPAKVPHPPSTSPDRERQVIERSGGERSTRTLDLGIMSSDFTHKSLFIQSLGDEPFGRAPVFVRVFTYDLACGGTKSDTVKPHATFRCPSVPPALSLLFILV